MAKATLWQDATIATMVGDSYGLINDAAMLVMGGKIEWIGEKKNWDPAPYSDVNIVSAKGLFISPGLIDCHTHLVYGGNRASEWVDKLEGKAYEAFTTEEKGIYSTVNATREISEKHLLAVSIKRAQSMLQEGVTTLEIKSGYGLDLATERKILKVARQIQKVLPLEVQTTFLGAHMLALEFADNEQYLQYLCDEVLPQLISENLIDAVDGFCETIAFSEKELEKLFALATIHSLKLKIHTDQLHPSKGAALISKYKGLSADHLEYLDEAGVQALKEANIVAVLLPGAHYFLKQTKIPPIALLRRYKIPMAIATDCNPGTSPTTSLPLMMNMACVEYGLTPLEALQGVTVHAAQALGLNKGRGQLQVGAQADFVIWDCKEPIELSYYFGSKLCSKVIKKGELAYEA